MNNTRCEFEFTIFSFALFLFFLSPEISIWGKSDVII